MNNYSLVRYLLVAIQHQQNPHRLMRESEAAAYLNVSARTLARWREDRVIGCIQPKQGLTVLYRRDHLDEFLQKSEIRPATRRRAQRIQADDLR